MQCANIFENIVLARKLAQKVLRILTKFNYLADFNKQNVLVYKNVGKSWGFRYLLHTKLPTLSTFNVSEGLLKRVLNSANIVNKLCEMIVG